MSAFTLAQSSVDVRPGDLVLAVVDCGIVLAVGVVIIHVGGRHILVVKWFTLKAAGVLKSIELIL